MELAKEVEKSALEWIKITAIPTAAMQLYVSRTHGVGPYLDVTLCKLMSSTAPISLKDNQSIGSNFGFIFAGELQMDIDFMTCVHEANQHMMAKLLRAISTMAEVLENIMHLKFTAVQHVAEFIPDCEGKDELARMQSVIERLQSKLETEYMCNFNTKTGTMPLEVEEVAEFIPNASLMLHRLATWMNSNDERCNLVEGLTILQIKDRLFKFLVAYVWYSADGGTFAKAWFGTVEIVVGQPEPTSSSDAPLPIATVSRTTTKPCVGTFGSTMSNGLVNVVYTLMAQFRDFPMTPSCPLALHFTEGFPSDLTEKRIKAAMRGIGIDIEAINDTTLIELQSFQWGLSPVHHGRVTRKHNVSPMLYY